MKGFAMLTSGRTGWIEKQISACGPAAFGEEGCLRVHPLARRGKL